MRKNYYVHTYVDQILNGVLVITAITFLLSLFISLHHPEAQQGSVPTSPTPPQVATEVPTLAYKALPAYELVVPLPLTTLAPSSNISVKKSKAYIPLSART